jgi:hypothetical protein
MTTTEAKQIADTFLAQLGGNRFIAMTGAKMLTFGEKGELTFRIGSGATQGINCVKITLDADDTYTMTFYKIRGLKVTVVKEIDMVYAEDLRRVFTVTTGFRTSL